MYDACAAALGAALRQAQDLEVLNRFVFQVCGMTVGIGTVCLLDLSLEQADAQRLWEAAASAPLPVLADRETSRALPDQLARQLVRKNSRLQIQEAYSFVGGQPLGSGSFGEVWTAVHRGTGVQRALKRISKQDVAEPALLAQEIEAQRRMDHPNVCRLIEWFETASHLWLVMELCHGEELCSHLLSSPTGLPEPEVARLMLQMLRATRHCHQRSIVHRDLKPENFLLGSVPGDPLKLIDFGYSAAMEPTSESGALGSSSRGSVPPALAVGTLLYMSPQSLRGEPPEYSDDVWSLGVILHILLTGRFPFSTNDDARFQELSARNQLQQDVQVHLKRLAAAAPAAADLASKLLAFDPLRRVTIEDAMRHPFLVRARGGPVEQPCGAQEVYESMDRFLHAPRFKRLAAALISWFAREDAGRIRDTFLVMDRSSRGSITVEELLEFLRCQGVEPSESWSTTLSKGELAMAGPEGVSYTAFSAAMMDLSNQPEGTLRVVFDLLDADHDGMVSAEDLHQQFGLNLGACDTIIVEARAAVSLPTGPCAPRRMGFADFQRLLRSDLQHGGKRLCLYSVAALTQPGYWFGREGAVAAHVHR